MKKTIAFITSLIICGAFTGCGNGGSSKITVISREDGSGTRSAFTEITGVLSDDKDNTVATAEISQSTAVVISSVAGNKNAVGYISLGSLSDDVKAVKIDGVEAAAEKVKDGSYAIARPFNICTSTKNTLSEPAADFITFILSEDGQEIISQENYISTGSDGKYTSSDVSGKITVAGSTSVAPVMEKLADAYKVLNPDVTIEVQQTGSSAGIQSTIEGVCDIGMSSRELKDSELAEGLASDVIAMDGIAVIVNKENAVENLTLEQVKQIYTGEITDWNDLNE